MHDPEQTPGTWKALAVLATGLVLLWLSFSWFQQNLLAEEKVRLQPLLASYGNNLASVINQRLALLKGLHAFVRSRADLADLKKEFPHFAAELQAGETGVRAIQVFPANGPVMVYPREGNEQTIGRSIDDLRQDSRPGVRADVARAINSRHVVLSRPYELRQGGRGMVARQAIYRDDRLWGLAVVVLDLPPLLDQAGLASATSPLALTLKDQQGKVFWGQAGPAANALTYPVRLTGGEWVIAALPEQGRGFSQRAESAVFILVGLLISGLMAILTYAFSGQKARLQRLVNERTRSLQNSENSYRNLVDSLPLNICTKDRSLRYLSINSNYARELGVQSAHVMGKGDADLFPDEVAERLRKHDRRVLETRQGMEYEQQFDDNGETRWTRWIKVPLRNESGDIDGVLGMSWDISERKRDENALLEANQRIREAVRGGNIGLWYWDLASDRVEFSSEWKAQIGYEEDEIEDSFEEWRDRIHPQDLPASLAAIGRAVKESSDDYHAEFRLRHKDGSWRWIVSTGSVISDSAGKALKVVGVHVDITERRRIEDSLRESEAQLKEAHNLAGLGFWRWDVASGQVTWTDEVYKIFDLDPASFNPTIESILALSPWEEDQQRGRELIARATSSHEPGTYEQRFLRPDGSIGYYLSTFRGHYDSQDRLVEIQGTVQDITTRKEAEIQLLGNERRATLQRQALADLTLNTDLISGSMGEALKRLVSVMATTLSVARASVWLLSEDRRALENAVLYEAETQHYSSGAVLDVSEFPAYFDAINADNRVFVEDCLKDERTRGLVDDYLAPLGITSLLDAGIFVDGQLVGVVSFEHIGPRRSWFSDEEAFVSNLAALVGQWLVTSKNRRTSAALAESEKRFRTMFEEAPLGVALINSRNGAILEVNKRYAEIVGLTIEQMETIDWMSITHPDDIQPDLDNMQRMNSGDIAGFSMEKRYIRPDGTIVWVNLTVSCVFKDPDVPVHLAMVEDISKRKRDEQELLELSSNLEKRVNQRTAELLAANEELDSFAYAVSHDLRAPLRAINGFSTALIQDHADEFEGDARVYLEQVSIASTKMGELIDALLTLSRSTRGEMIREKVDLSGMFQQRLQELGREDPGREIDSTVEAGMSVKGDPRMLMVVVNNLLDNAWKYTANEDLARIKVYREKVDKLWRYCVRDNGAGFEMAYVGRLFKPFQRLHRQDEFPGIGIGLATVQRIIHRHGGEISATATPGEGACICFTIGQKIQGDA